VDAAKQMYEVQIAGLPLKLRSSHDHQTVNELISLVNDRVGKALELNPNISFQKAVLLASLNIAEDLLFFKRTAHLELNELERKAKRVLTELESAPPSRGKLEN
jgi:cell division protein ZapA